MQRANIATQAAALSTGEMALVSRYIIIIIIIITFIQCSNSNSH